MTSYKVVQDSKREEFRKYLEKNGVMDALTRCLVVMYEEPERPADPLDHIRRTLGAASPEKLELENLRLASAELREKLAVIEQENQELQEKLGALKIDDEGPPTSAAAVEAAPTPPSPRKDGGAVEKK